MSAEPLERAVQSGNIVRLEPATPSNALRLELALALTLHCMSTTVDISPEYPGLVDGTFVHLDKCPSSRRALDSL
jgi:hypothetical protein